MSAMVDTVLPAYIVYTLIIVIAFVWAWYKGRENTDGGDESWQ